MKLARWTIALLFFLPGRGAVAQNIGVFTSIAPAAQIETLVLPPTHDFQLLAQTGDTLADGSILKSNPDFTAFVPKYDRNDWGYLSLNHEIGGLQGGVTVFDLKFNHDTKTWDMEYGLPVDFSGTGGISKPCSGAITPWGTVISGEESILNSDLDSNGYYDAGWLIESRPAERQFVQKIWKAGNAFHENCAIASDQKTLYWGADDYSRGFVFKYVATQRRQLQTGKLYVLVRDDSTSSTATWVQVPNTTPAQCNNINGFCQQVGAWNFSGIEDVEIGPYGKIYFASKYSGRVWRFKDKGPVATDLEVFVENTSYPIATSNGIQWTPWGIGADNLAFDNANNLWVLQDGGNNHIWMVKPTHTAANPKISLFANTPAGSEPTGITFTPDKRFMFLSFQHPNSTNNDTVLDVRGKPLVFNRGTTIVIGRKEFLGRKAGECPKESGHSIHAATGLALSPNPSHSGHVTLTSARFQRDMPITVSVFNPFGAICHQGKYLPLENKITLDFQAKVKGVYMIQAFAKGELLSARLLIQ